MTRTFKNGRQEPARNGELYDRSYAASITILKNIVPFIKNGDEVRKKLTHSAKEVPRLIAAGLHASVHPVRKSHTLCEAALHCRESAVMLSFCRDLHGQFINGSICKNLIETYQTIGDELGEIIQTRDEPNGVQS